MERDRASPLPDETAGPSRRSFFALLAAVAVVPLGGVVLAPVSAEAEAAGIIVHDGWVLRSTDLTRLAQR